MNTAELQELDIHFIQPTNTIHFDYRPIRIRVYKNGEESDKGKVLTVTRREFKHWVIFLDGITQKLKTSTAVHRLYTIQGIKVEHFDELEHRGEYVAVEKGPFISCRYGIANNWTNNEHKWKSLIRVNEARPAFLNSAETMDIYLKNEGYGTITGLPYPFDGILTRSPSTSALHLKSHKSHVDKFGGSYEKLNKIGRNIWEEENNKLKKEDSHIVLPKLEGLTEDVTTNKDDKQKEQIESKPDEVPLVLPPINPSIEQPKMPEETKEKENIQNNNNNNKETVEDVHLPPINNKDSRIPVKVHTIKVDRKIVSGRPGWNTTNKQKHEVRSEVVEECFIPWGTNYRQLSQTQLFTQKDRDSFMNSFNFPPKRSQPKYMSRQRTTFAIDPYDPDFFDY